MSNAAVTIRQFCSDCCTGAVDLLLPRSCGACGRCEVMEEGLCEECSLRLLSLVSLPYCIRCGATIGPNLPVREDGCSNCPTTLPRYRRVYRLGPYTMPLRSVIRELKYRRREEMRRRLGAMLAEVVAAQREGEPPMDVVLAVPMHWWRRIARGYDHAAVLAREAARRLDLPVGDELRRVRNTPPQAQLPRSRRIQNIRGAFMVARPSSIMGAHVLLIDDVTTTGATANEASRTLLAAGASHVSLAVIAKAEPPRAYSQHLGSQP